MEKFKIKIAIQERGKGIKASRTAIRFLSGKAGKGIKAIPDKYLICMK